MNEMAIRTIINTRKKDIWLCGYHHPQGLTEWPESYFTVEDWERLAAYPGLQVVHGKIGASTVDRRSTVEQIADLLSPYSLADRANLLERASNLLLTRSNEPEPETEIEPEQPTTPARGRVRTR